MKKLIFYIALVLTGNLLSSYTYNINRDFIPEHVRMTHINRVNINPEEEKPTGFAESMSGKIGKTFVVNGLVKEVYKNKHNEVVIYLKDKKIPIIINCALTGSEYQIKYPLKLGEYISIKGKFIQISDEMYMVNCKIIKRAPK